MVVDGPVALVTVSTLLLGGRWTLRMISFPLPLVLFTPPSHWNSIFLSSKVPEANNTSHLHNFEIKHIELLHYCRGATLPLKESVWPTAG